MSHWVRPWQPPPLTEADMVPADWVVWWRWSSVTGEWTRHTRQAPQQGRAR